MIPEKGRRLIFVFWCPEDFPADIAVTWDFWPVREPGLCILFFPLWDEEVKIYLIRHWRRALANTSSITAAISMRYTCLTFGERHSKNARFKFAICGRVMVFTWSVRGGSLPSVVDARPPYPITLIKCGAEVVFYIRDLKIFHWVDDGQTYGPLLGGGKIGFRQMAPLIGEYANLKVHEVNAQV